MGWMNLFDRLKLRPLEKSYMHHTRHMPTAGLLPLYPSGAAVQIPYNFIR
jgi:hypothetical protein